MSIYSRDNIAYQSMIDNMINNRLKTMERQSNRIQKEADIASDTAKGLASTFARGMDYAQAASEQAELENKLKDLEARRDYIRSQYDYNADYKPYTSTDAYKASEQMKGYKPDYDVNLINTNVGDKYKTGSTYIVDDAKTKWLQAHPGMTEADYEQFVAYQNALYGGR